VGGSYRQTTTTTTTQVSTTIETNTFTTTLVRTTIQWCGAPSTPIPPEGVESNTSLLVYATNSTAWVCVNIANNANLTVSDGSPPTVWILQNGGWSNSANLNVTAQPASFKLYPNTVEWYLFQITPLVGTRAIYSVGLPTECWGDMLVAVGDSTTQLQGTKLSLPNTSTYCPEWTGFSTINALTNMTPVYTK
jgi:hypothetical protein